MAITFQAMGTAVSATTGTLTVPWPAGHAIYDVALMFVTSSGGGTTQTLTTAAGFTLIGTANVGSGTFGTRLSVYWARATTTTQASPVLTGGAGFKYGVIANFRGVLSSATPFEATNGNVKATASTSASLNDITTLDVDRMIVGAITSDVSSTSAFVTSYTNTNITSLTKQFDAGTVSGDGGGISVMTGYKAVAGATGVTSVVLSTSSINAFLILALIPEPPITAIANNFEGGTDAVAITDVNSGGTSGRAIVTTAKNGGTTLTFSSTKARDTLSLKGTYPVAGAGYAVWSWTSSLRTALRFYFYCEGVIDNGYIEIARFRNSANTNASAVSITTRNIEFYGAGGTKSASAPMKLQPDAWYRVEFATTIGTSSTTGRIEAAVYDGDSLTPFYTYDSGPTIDTGTTSFNSYRQGMAGGPATNAMAIYFDDISIQEKTSGFIGPSAAGTTYDTTQFMPFL